MFRYKNKYKRVDYKNIIYAILSFTKIYAILFQDFHFKNMNFIVQETAFLFIPNSAVGAIIGTKGSNIRNTIRFSGASVKVASTENEKPGAAAAGDANSPQQASRKVTIVGTAEAQWKVIVIYV